MNNYDWIDNINNNFYKTPVIVEKDSDYLPELKEKLTQFTKELKLSTIDDSVALEIEKYTDEIIDSLEQYYKGNITVAQKAVSGLLSSFNSPPAVTLVNDCLAFPAVDDPKKSEVQFFRARLSENVRVYSAEEMLHIPFSNREIIKSERFSIPGLPCLYLANSSYCCWIEMGSPAEHRFNVSPFVLDNTQHILNLTVSIYELNHILGCVQKSNRMLDDNYVIDLLKLFLLTLSTSFRVNSKNRSFKSEYILPQLIMLAAKDMGIDGVSYLSKQVDNDLLACVVGVNVVLFATFNGEKSYSEICNHLSNGDSFNFSMFKQLLPCQLYKQYDLRIVYSPYTNNIGTFKRPIKYQETQFYEFDKYIFANWERTP